MRTYVPFTPPEMMPTVCCADWATAWLLAHTDKMETIVARNSLLIICIGWREVMSRFISHSPVVQLNWFGATKQSRSNLFAATIVVLLSLILLLMQAGIGHARSPQLLARDAAKLYAEAQEQTGSKRGELYYRIALIVEEIRRDHGTTMACAPSQAWQARIGESRSGRTFLPRRPNGPPPIHSGRRT